MLPPIRILAILNILKVNQTCLHITCLPVLPSWQKGSTANPVPPLPNSPGIYRECAVNNMPCAPQPLINGHSVFQSVGADY